MQCHASRSWRLQTADQTADQDKLIDLLEYLFPGSWRKQILNIIKGQRVWKWGNINIK